MLMANLFAILILQTMAGLMCWAIQIPINTRTFPIRLEALHSVVQHNHTRDKSMNTFVVSEKQGQILLPLPILLERLGFLPTVLWAFREVTIRYPLPFGLSVQ